MKILLLSKNFDLGGTEKHVRELANALAGQGHEIFLVSRPGRQQEHLHESVTHLRWYPRDLTYPFLVRKLSRLIRDEGIEIVHGHQRLGISLGASAAHRAGIPAVATVHGQVKYDLRSATIRARLDRVIMVADNRLEQARDPALRAKSLVLHNGIAMEPDPARTTPPRFTACYISRLDTSHFKALKILITEVWPRLPEARLRIVGDGPCLNELRELISRHDPTGSIEAVGFQSEVTGIIRESSLVLGVGRVAIEALGQKVPVLSLNGHFCGEIISSENYARMKELNFVARDDAPPDASILLARLSSFRENQALHEGETGELFSRVYEDFSLDSSIAKLTALYRQLIGQTQSRDATPTSGTSSSA